MTETTGYSICSCGDPMSLHDSDLGCYLCDCTYTRVGDSQRGRKK